MQGLLCLTKQQNLGIYINAYSTSLYLNFLLGQ